MKKFMTMFILIITILPAQCSHLHLEKEYQEKWTKEHNGIMEYCLDDRTRVDCLLPEYAVEFDFANKVYEGIGQAFYYASQTGKKPAVVLIMENPEQEQKYLNKLKAVSEVYGLKYWIIKREYLENN
jgi:hypothetical protein